MGKKIRFIQEEKAALFNDQMTLLRQKSLPRKQNKRLMPIELPAICGRYPFQRPIENFKSSSRSQLRRSVQLLRHLYCLYGIPAWLLEWLTCEGELELTSASHERSAALLMAIIYEMGSGRSPRFILKAYLSKVEMSLFFKVGKPTIAQGTIFSWFIYCKALAKALPQSVCIKLAQVTAQERLDKEDVFHFVQKFIDFCATRKVNSLSVQDIWDYLSKNDLIGNFSFKGRTLASVLNLVNAWHEELNREARILFLNRQEADRQARIDALKIRYEKARGIPVSWTLFDKETSRHIEICQLRSYTELINEGRSMHHCVASYHYQCAQNASQIYSLRVEGERKATIEVRQDTVFQIRGPCNQRITGFLLQCVQKWMKMFKLHECS